MSDADLGSVLLTIARCAIGERLGRCAFEAGEGAHEALLRHAATFVTLRRSGRLRGCVGSLQQIRPLGLDVRENAIAAAFRDPRFLPLEAAELEATSVEVSLLSAEERIEAASEADLAARLRPGVDGLILEYAGRRATFLPQVWGLIEDPREFVAALKHKAGLPSGFWEPGLNASRYAVTHWQEPDSAPIGAGR
jgi:AmmeMemoRadiSam system protein A